MSIAARFRLHYLALLMPALLVGEPLAGQEPGSIGVHRHTETPTSKVGLSVGAPIPEFKAPDQDGRIRDFSSVRGPKGAVIYFFRSASWCIYCRAQLVATQESTAALRRNGLGVVGISYDPPEVLKQFADEMGITFPLLSDSESRIIRDFETLDATVLPGEAAYGVPYHGSYVVDEAGVVVSKLFDSDAVLGHSTGVVVSKLFGSPVNTHERLVRHDRLTLSYYASKNFVSPGDEVELTIAVALNEGLHVYAPQAGPYVPVEFKLESSPAFSAQPVILPPAEMLYVPSVGEEAAVYTDEFQLVQRIRIGPDAHRSAMADSQGNVAVSGTFRFQACDAEKCYLPTDIPLEWRLGGLLLTEHRVPHDHSAELLH